MDLQLLSQCGSTSNCLSRSVGVIPQHVAGTLRGQSTNQPTATIPGGVIPVTSALVLWGATVPGLGVGRSGLALVGPVSVCRDVSIGTVGATVPGLGVRRSGLALVGPVSVCSDVSIGTVVATVPDAWCWKVRAGTGWPGVCMQ